jgi:hypothetical protein
MAFGQAQSGSPFQLVHIQYACLILPSQPLMPPCALLFRHPCCAVHVLCACHSWGGQAEQGLVRASRGMSLSICLMRLVRTAQPEMVFGRTAPALRTVTPKQITPSRCPTLHGDVPAFSRMCNDLTSTAFRPNKRDDNHYPPAADAQTLLTLASKLTLP